MKQSLMPKKNLIGIGTRTKNADETDGNGKIPALWGKFFSEVLPKLKKTENFIYAVYKDYESDENGEYFYFIGIPSDEKAPFETVQLPEERYLEFSSSPGKIPEIVVQLWRKVWSDSELKNRRAFKVDYEIYPMDFSTVPETQVLLFLSDKQ
ncbi:GyrI-like domain-containing protein [Leptospira santarosai]|uniref:Transcriptional regulator n=2 Tax=Leptospira santarosai TaxID=28183 RepID=K8YAR1_9LEPT|nr:effector binding domain-containing protein [Leptospira santarosai]ASV11848.1 AraC family transcriptional regulator [Leptospira santarosai]EKT87542.1 transcriptional regulator [Leptospira santarosai serovar Shermani str. LT 821]EMF89846.1 GyrI-like small molecule binding domain protein [Leptospira santarosai str. ST188]EMO15676.1 GyrI-like small molecule binding domain protein [Leptospira santarosai str. CBC523]EMO72376.1 GyrI-like small molecule binding domain protein [Leptospira santarosai